MAFTDAYTYECTHMDYALNIGEMVNFAICILSQQDLAK